MTLMMGEAAYEADRKDVEAVLEVAKKLVPHGIYALIIDDCCELVYETFATHFALLDAVADYIGQGFEVRWNK